MKYSVENPRDTPPTKLVARASKAKMALVRMLWRAWGPITRKNGPFPDFLGIGAQKSGTTWLHVNLQLHPEIFMPEQKELHYFDSVPHRGWYYYRSQFNGHDGRKCGEITPAYGILPRATIRDIHRERPDLKLILLLRNPIERAWSGATMDLADRHGRTVAEIPQHEFEAYLRTQGSIQRGTYSAIIDRWTEFFPSEQLFVGFFESIQEQPEQLFRAVLDPIGVSSDIRAEEYELGSVVVPELDPARCSKESARKLGDKRTAQRIPTDLRQMLGEIYGTEIEELKRRFGAPCDDWIAEHEAMEAPR